MVQYRIAVNTRLLLRDKLEGIGWFTFETLRRICTRHPEHEFVFIFDREPDPMFLFSGNITPVVLKPQARHPFLFYLWFSHRLPALLDRLKPDLFLSPDGYHALPYRGKSLLVIHDLNFEHYPQDLPGLVRSYYRYFFPRFARHATRIATVSAFSKNDIQACYGIPSERIDVVYDGVNTEFGPVGEAVRKATRARWTSSAPYFLFVGSLHPRKNLTTLFKAFDLFRQQDSLGHKLVIAGQKKWWTKEINEVYDRLQFKEDIVFTGRVPTAHLRELIGSALALVYISYFEGFGIPILEGFACHTPVIISDKTSLPEVAGQAALVTDPFSAADVAAAMTKLARSETLRKQLIEKGLQRLSFFSWDKTADLLWQSMLRTIPE